MTLTKTLLAAVVGVGALAGSNVAASAAIACNGNVCWHITERHVYPRGSGIVIREDNWRPRRGRIEFREHEGRGYWRGRTWREF